MFFQSVISEMYFVSCLHGRKKLEEIRICFSSGMFVLLQRHRKSRKPVFSRIEYTKSKHVLAYTKSILVSLMTKKIFLIILSRVKFWSNILISTKPTTLLPLPKQKKATKRTLIMLLFALFLQKLFSSCTPLSPPRFCPAKPNTYYAKEKLLSYRLLSC